MRRGRKPRESGGMVSQLNESWGSKIGIQSYLAHWRQDRAYVGRTSSKGTRQISMFNIERSPSRVKVRRVDLNNANAMP
jgi:hypothetical protein